MDNKEKEIFFFSLNALKISPSEAFFVSYMKPGSVTISNLVF